MKEDCHRMGLIKKKICALSFFVLLAACATVPTPQPAPPHEEEITILQKQLLELQKVQLDTKKKLDEANTVIGVLSKKVAALEEKQSGGKSVQGAGPSKPHETSGKKTPSDPSKKSTVKKKTKTRRQK